MRQANGRSLVQSNGACVSLDMIYKPHLPCVILAGGGSRRFGSTKGLAVLNGKPLVEIVKGRLAHQTAGPIAINADAAGEYGRWTDEIVEDVFEGGLGPLAGLHAAMKWAAARGHNTVLTTPVDAPFLPLDLVEKLANAGAPSVAKSDNQIHAVCGLWPVSLLLKLENEIEKGARAAQHWADICGANNAQFEFERGHDPFFNINTPEDLCHAKRF